MFTVSYVDNKLNEHYYKCDSLKEARAFATSLRDIVHVGITDGDKEYDLVPPALH